MTRRKFRTEDDFCTQKKRKRIAKKVHFVSNYAHLTIIIESRCLHSREEITMLIVCRISWKTLEAIEEVESKKKRKRSNGKFSSLSIITVN